MISTQVMRIGWNLRLGMTVALQKKLLRTRAAEVSRVSTGFIVSLVTNDCQRFDNLLPFLHAPWVSAILIVVAYFLISNIVGYAASAAGLSVLLVSVAIQARLGFVFKKLRAKTATRTDGRVRLISELLNGILSVKAFAWEEPCLEAVAARHDEHLGVVEEQPLDELLDNKGARMPRHEDRLRLGVIERERLCP